METPKELEGLGFARSILFTRAVRGTRVKRNRRRRAAGGSRKGEGNGVARQIRALIYRGSIPSTGRVSASKKKHAPSENRHVAMTKNHRIFDGRCFLILGVLIFDISSKDLKYATHP